MLPRMTRLPARTWALVLFTVAGCSAPHGAGTRSTVAGASADSAIIVPATPAQIAALIARPGARATMVNVWATWCAPCREEFPGLLRVARAHQREGARLILISADFGNQLSAARAFLTAEGVTDSTYIKDGGDMEFINAMYPKWSGALPATFIYDRNGHLVSFWEGKLDSSRFELSLSQVLGPR